MRDNISDIAASCEAQSYVSCYQPQSSRGGVLESRFQPLDWSRRTSRIPRGPFAISHYRLAVQKNLGPGGCFPHAGQESSRLVSPLRTSARCDGIPLKIVQVFHRERLQHSKDSMSRINRLAPRRAI